MRRRTRIILVLSLALAGAAGAGLVAYRVPILQSLLTASLRAAGAPAPRLAVTEIGWHGARIADIRLGDGDEVRARSAHLEYNVLRLVSGRLDRVTVDRMHVTLDLTGAGPPLGSLQPLVSGPGGGGALVLPPLSLTDLRLEAKTPAGVFESRGRGALDATEGGGMAVDLELDEIALAGDVLASGNMSLHFGAARAEAAAAVRGTSGGFAADFEGTVENIGTALQVHLDLSAEAAAEPPAAPVAGWPFLDTGHAELRLSADGRLPPFHQIVIAQGPGAVLAASDAAGHVELLVDDASLAGRFTGLRAGLRLDAALSAGSINFTLAEDARVAVAHVADVWLHRLGLPAQIADLLHRGVSARVAAQPARPLAVAKFGGDEITVALDGTLHLAVPEVVELALPVPLDLRLAPGRWQATLRAPAGAQLSALELGQSIALDAPLDLMVQEAGITILREPGGGGAHVEHRLTVESPSLHARLRPHDPHPIPLTVSALRLQHAGGRRAGEPYDGHVALSGENFEAPAHLIAAETWAADIRLESGETRVEVDIAGLQETGATPVLAPATLALALTGRGENWQGTATAEGPSGVGRLAASGGYNGATGRADVHVALAPLLFAPDGAQPGVLSPALSTLQNVAGSASAEADLIWSASGLQGTGAIELSDLSFDGPQARIEGLDLRLHLDSVLPLGSPLGQTLTIRRIDPGVPLDRFAVRYHIQPAAPPRLAIEDGEVFLGSGRISVRNVVLDPAATRQDAVLHVENLNLTELFAVFGIDGLSGEGLLSGDIPVVFAAGAVQIENGRLAAAGPGIVRFRSEQAARALAGQGESLDLLLRALEDFHYEELTVAIDISAADVGRLRLSLLGQNPAVLEGHPFRFNIAIEANPGRLLEALNTIYRMPTDMLRRAWTFGG